MTKGVINIIIGLLILIPVGIYFGVWDYYAINIPKWDDHALKAFLLEFHNAVTTKAEIAAVFRQHNEHRIALTRLFSLLDFSIFGKLNYRHLMMIGNVLLLAVIPLWYILLKNNKKPLFALVPVPFLWLTLSMWENMYWGMASIQNFGVVALTLWTLYLCVSPKPVPFGVSILLAAVTIFTSPNGIFVLPIGALLLFLAGHRQRMFVYILGVGTAVFYYFYGYNRPDYNPESKASLIRLVKGYMAFLGSFAESFPVLDHFAVCVFMGAIVFLVAVSVVSATLFRIMRNKYSVKFEKITDLFCLGTMLFILGTALVVVYSRAGFGLEGLITGKYKIYSVLLLLTAYLYIVIPIRGSFLSPYITGIVALAVTFNIFSYHYHLVDAYNLRKQLTMDQFNWIYQKKDLVPFNDTTYAGQIVEKTPVFYENWLPLLRVADRQGYAGDSRALTELYNSTKFIKSTNNLEVDNTSYTSQRLQDSGIYIVLSSKDRFYVFPGLRSRNRNRKQLFLKQYYFAPGFHASIPVALLEKGAYKVGVIRQLGDDTGILFKDTVVRGLGQQPDQIKVNW